MKIIVVCFLKLDELPPAITFLKVLSQKYDNIIYYGIDQEHNKYAEMFNHHVTFNNVAIPIKQEVTSLRDRIHNACAWRINNLLFRKVMGTICKQYEAGDIVWILHEHTLSKLGPNLEKIPYSLTMYELPYYLFPSKHPLKKRLLLAENIIVPEYCRSAIIKACVGMQKNPYIIPNKPAEYDDVAMELKDNPIISVAEKAHAEDKKVIIYSGIFLRERKLDTIIKAVLRNPDKYVMVLVGRKSEYLTELLKTYPSIQYLGFFTPPMHLSVIEHADVGVLTYVPDCGSINPVFCAPNKTWEYAKFGIPMICNDIPGLKYTVEYNGMGFCCDIDDESDIEDKLSQICNNYDVLSQNAKKYYDSTDVEALIGNII